MAGRIVEQASGELRGVVLAELDAAGRADSSLGRVALVLAARIDAGQLDTGSSLASLVRELRSTLHAALFDTPSGSDVVDELQRRRERRIARGAPR